MTLQEHCEHELVCRFYVDNGPCRQPDILSSICEHDSRRSPPHPTQAQQRIDAAIKKIQHLRIYTDDTFEEGKFLERDAVLKAIALLREGERG